VTADDELADAPSDRRVAASATPFRSGRVIDVRTDQVVMSDGTATRDVVVHPGAVGIIALNDADEVLLLQQYRHPVGRLLWEPPAGLCDEAGEPAVDTARRELYEEAHLEAGRWDVLVDYFSSPGLTDEAVRVFLARDVRPSTRAAHVGAHEEVDMPVRWVPLDAAVEAVLAGRLHNPVAIAGLLALAASRSRGLTTLRPADVPWPEASEFTGSSVEGAPSGVPSGAPRAARAE
jgi:ADP-ribose pyrophosphatase